MGMWNTLEARYACDLLRTLAGTHEAALKRGLMRRTEMVKAMEKGESVSGYRSDWISQSADRVLQVLRECAKTLHEEHPDDRASALDLIDILATARSRVAP